MHSAHSTSGKQYNCQLDIDYHDNASHKVVMNHVPGVGGMAVGFAGGAFFLLLRGKRRRYFLPVVLLMCAGAFVGCGGSGSSNGTPAGSYAVNVAATSVNITRTATFTVTVQ